MNCEQGQEYISHFMDGELDPANEGSMFQHLSTCRNCQTFLKDNLTLRGSLSAIRPVTVPTSLDQHVLQQPLMQHSIGFRKTARYSIRTMVLAATCSLSIGIGISTFWYKTQLPQHMIVCLTPLPEVEVTGYVVIGYPQMKGHQQ